MKAELVIYIQPLVTATNGVTVKAVPATASPINHSEHPALFEGGLRLLSLTLLYVG